MKKPSVKYLRKKADKLYQIKLIKEKRRSIISGEPTQVIHHFISKSQSNSLRYDDDNGIPLTNKEHARHHLSGDPSIVAKIILEKGKRWFEKLQIKRKIITRLNKGYLREVISRLES